MFCPNCATEENQPKQFCRVCGTDLRGVRNALEQREPTSNQQSSTRDEIGKILALKIHEVESAHDLKKVAEDVLPQIEKFLESPEERTLRTIRSGVVTAAIGLAAMVFLGLFSIFFDKGMAMIALAGIVPFIIGIGIMINGMFFTPASKHKLDRLMEKPINTTNELPITNMMSSITDHTTQQLPPEGRKIRE